MSPRASRTANRALWTAQALIALLFIFAGAMKFIMSPAQMQQGPISLPITFLRFIGACEVLGGLGLLLPGLVRRHGVLTPLAAIGLTIIMIGATEVSVLSFGLAAGIFPAVVGVVTTLIAFGRTRPSLRIA